MNQLLRSGIIFLLACLSFAAEVGSLGLTESLDFNGNQTFSTDLLRKSLADDAAYLLASHPRAPLNEFLEVLARRIVIGYQAGGFPQATATATADGDRVLVRLSEGSRFIAGKVLVQGNRIISTERMVSGLTTPQPKQQAWYLKTSPKNDAKKDEKKIEKPEDPIWDSGKPAHCNDSFITNLTEQVTQLYAYQGHLKAQLIATLNYLPDHSVDLLITITDEGKEASLGEVVFHGLARNDQVALEHFLDLRIDMPVNADTAKITEERLRSSGRFVTQKVAIEPLDDSARFRLAVTVMESRCLPPVHEPLSAAEAVLMRTHAWLVEWLRSGGDDLVLDSSIQQDQGRLDLRFILSPKRGFILVLDPHSKATGAWRSALAIVDHRIVVASTAMGHGVRYRSVSHFSFSGSVTGCVDDKPEEKKSRDKGSFSISIMGSTKGTPALLNMDLAIEANPILNIAHYGNNGMILSADVLSFNQEDMNFQLETNSGRLKGLTSTKTTPELNKRDRLVFSAGALDREIINMEAWSRDLIWNQDESTASFAEVGSQILGEVQALANGFCTGDDPKIQQQVKGYRGIIALIQAFVPYAACLQEIFGNDEKDKKEDRFFIPVNATTQNNHLAAFACLPAFVAGQLSRQLSVDTWPVVLLRDTCGVMTGDTRYINHDLQKLAASDDFGPLGCLAVGKALKIIALPQLAKIFGQLGAERLDDTHVAADFRLLRPYAGELARILASLPENTPILDLVDPTHRDAVKALFARLRAQLQAGGSPDKLVDTLCLDLWRLAFKDKIKEALKDLAEPPKPKESISETIVP